ncbi:hemin uptake protein HemP [Rubrimonas cliftonensis]|uniref:Hemin uptake protein HemP n=1 Tax=Rubrimonas cliftonensis TaxID=89524 RepID=A0A1H4BBI4_9RHOB|nr:hemin uptake protein HemP [Rubrimonas cliftonensis]SEA45414.1 Hemin uptake protein HemP [Rubrimonas cliftonensis]
MSYFDPALGAPATARPAPSQTLTEASVDSATLLAGSRILLIRHAGETYTLRLTRQNKLLLTK